MLRGDRGQVLAVIIGLILAFNAGMFFTALDYRSDYQERYPSYIDGPTDSAPPPEDNQAGVDTPSKKTPCENPGNREESDLCAQWRAATGAKQAAQFALWQLVLSILGVLGLGFTLWFNKQAIDLALDSAGDTEKALEIARRNADAATRQAEVAEDTAKRQLRAYVQLRAAQVYKFADSQTRQPERPHPEQRYIEVDYMNYGKTPAHKLQAVFGAAVIPHPISSALPPPPDSVDRATSDLPAGRKGMIPLEVFGSGPMHDNILKGTHAIYVWGFILYEDVFGEPHRTDIALFSTGDAYRGGAFQACREGNEAG